MKKHIKHTYSPLTVIWPITKTKLHRLVSLVGTVFAAFSVFELWYATLGLSTPGKIGGTLGVLATYATSWKSLRPKIDSAVDTLPIPKGASRRKTEKGFVE